VNGHALDSLGDHGGAERAVRRAIAIALKAYGPDHAKVIDAKRTLAMIQISRQSWQDAEATLLGAIVSQHKLGELTPLDSLELALAHVYVNMERFAAARAATDRAKPIIFTQGENSYMVAKWHEARARVEHGAGNHDRAKAELRIAHAMLTKLKGAEHLETQIVERFLREKHYLPMRASSPALNVFMQESSG